MSIDTAPIHSEAHSTAPSPTTAAASSTPAALTTLRCRRPQRRARSRAGSRYADVGSSASQRRTSSASSFAPA